MLDHSLRHFKRELNNAMDNVLDFRRICKKYLLNKASGDHNLDSDEEMLTYDNTGFGGGQTCRGPARKRYEREGVGLLKVHSPDFTDRLKECL